MRARRLLLLVSLAPLAGGAALLAQQGWLAAKAQVAGMLIERAFVAHLEDKRPHPPWDWADMHPIARLEVPRLGIRRTVLSGCSGSSMAFGPGHIDGSARPNGRGNCALAGHRDSWFAFLERLRPGDEIRLRTADGTRRYRVATLEVRSMRDAAVLEATAGRRLTLITCYPFDGLGRGELRYVITCEEDEEDRARSGS
jgi:sortase A